MRGALRRIAVLAARLLPAKLLERIFVGAVYARALSLPPRDALRMLFRIDAALYALQGDRAVAYGNGTHPKHRHMRYHDFFTERIRADERVLDVGCGIGALAHSIASRSGATVVGVDISPEKIAQARATYAHPGVEYVSADATRQVPGDAYDVVVLSNVLEHLADRPEFLRTVLGNVSARRALIRVPLFERDWRVPLKREVGVEWRLDPTHETEYTLESFQREMEDAGVEVVECRLRWGEIWAEVTPARSATLLGSRP
jgi:SAM-dependent methyltransferase